MSEEIEMVTIPKHEYNHLVEDATFLRALEGAGVDNWDGYSIAYNEAFPDDEEESEEVNEE